MSNGIQVLNSRMGNQNIHVVLFKMYQINCYSNCSFSTDLSDALQELCIL